MIKKSKNMGTNSMGLDVYLNRTDEIQRYLLFTKIYKFFFNYEHCTSTWIFIHASTC